MKYEEMSDRKLSYKVAAYMVKKWETAPLNIFDDPKSGSGVLIQAVGGGYCAFDINNPSDAWPVIVENRIAVNPYGNPAQGWFADYESKIHGDSDSPLRAAMIVFLKMREGE